MKRLLLIPLFCFALRAQTGNDATTPFSNAAVTTAVNVTGAHGLWGWNLFNGAATVRFLQVFNQSAGSVTLGTTVPLMNIAVGATAVNSQTVGPKAAAFSGSGFSVAATTTAGGGTPCGTAMVVNIFFL